MNEPVDIIKILDLIPHRYPFILVDRVLDYQELNYLKAIKNVTINEPFFEGHFPGNPIMPGVLMLEALAQASAILFSLSHTAKEGYEFLHFFAGIDNAKFKQIVTPGDQLRLEVQLVGQKRDFWRMHGEAYVGDRLACSADLLSATKEIKSDK
ncbi:3-hydroxyacyl-ACP dehydratase FabZ [Legionella israelensis]|uniref:3-hydroxyacyl-[acyl-carrier-protein] dehydratase FabZ n=1 Tax=Legionella israelensis TaxID=454 RepID=A0A0W0V703_9GAMM|nr:3-hydroxyacyl-ACP dehydratase FabZ [Legionella israelensis]KTD15907.1 (3R)-hydroxymyristoyl-ACP dehydratase [Legionella israelensis]QBR83320.1 3-hydroxyacyl-ACP dehydratase FabZ [Legionella israelensis]QBS09304.1 3-hydroxyacyl-ACP dehydratase FabZ [Legionella israelensis]QDP71851.1 3-hydroxyacyl-ACP dehydratase FabZ [Legionella israelensis]SCY22042.1 3-hydroxyacyl-[acyl-carrier-protein] dehydratase [Legionella israelensis DSM 19235]